MHTRIFRIFQSQIPRFFLNPHPRSFLDTDSSFSAERALLACFQTSIFYLLQGTDNFSLQNSFKKNYFFYKTSVSMYLMSSSAVIFSQPTTIIVHKNSPRIIISLQYELTRPTFIPAYFKSLFFVATPRQVSRFIRHPTRIQCPFFIRRRAHTICTLKPCPTSMRKSSESPTRYNGRQKPILANARKTLSSE